MTSIHKILNDIQDEGSFDQLDQFKDVSKWSKMNDPEKELFARLLLKQGGIQLAQGSPQVLESFELALKVSNYSSSIYYHQGIIFAAYRDNMRCLSWAHQAFTFAFNQNPNFFEALYCDALVLIDMGQFDNESDYLFKAIQKLEIAAKLVDFIPADFKLENLYWHWGLCYSLLGKCSGEPLDYNIAVEKFRMTEELGCNNALFLNDYGNALAELAALLEKPEYYHEAFKQFTAAIESDPNAFEGWYNQGCCIFRLSETKFDIELIEQAEISFERASEINSEYSLLWLRWGQLNSIHGKFKHDTSLIELSLEKFSMANRLDPDHPQILAAWSEVELFLGAQQERLDMIQSARAKLLKSLEIYSENSDVWYFYGSCLNELGRYFSDETYYHQAIEKFQYGLSLERQSPLLWYGQALAHYALGELTDDPVMFEKAVRFCGKVIECGGGGFSQFWNDWGVAYMKLAEITLQPQHLELAIEKFERALKHPMAELNVDDVDLEWVYNYGCAFDLLGEFKEEPRYFEKAVQILSQVVQVDPEYHQARYNLALALANLGEVTYELDHYQKSIEHFQILLANDAEDEIVQMDFGVTLVNIALLVHDDHHPEKSQALFRQAETHLLQSASLGNSQSYYQLACLYSLTDRFQYAMHYIERTQFFGALPPMEDLLHDDWLEGLRHTPSFRQFINTLSSKSKEETK